MLSPSSLFLSHSQNQEKWDLFPLCPFCSNLIFKLREWPKSCHMSTLARVCFCPKTIYFVSVQVQIIFYDINLSYFQIYQIFVKILFLEVIGHQSPSKNVKFRLSRNSTKFIHVTRFREINPMVRSVSLYRI